MLEIEHTAILKQRYEVRDDSGLRGEWHRQIRREGVVGELAGHHYEMRRENRKLLTYLCDGQERASAAGRRLPWTMVIDGAQYVLKKRKWYSSDLQLVQGGVLLGEIVKRRGLGRVIVDLQSDLDPGMQAFVGFCALTIWTRDANSSNAAMNSMNASNAASMSSM